MSDRLDEILPDALHRLARRAPAEPLDAARIRRRVIRRRWMIAAPAAVVLIVASLLTGMALFQPYNTMPAGPAEPSTCAPLQTGTPPEWAQGGFTGNGYPPFATSSSGEVIAFVFANPLSAPPEANRNNKILWVQHNGHATGAQVTARLEGTDRVTHLRLSDGPSIVDMPAAGCWHLEWSVAGKHDYINLRWIKP